MSNSLEERLRINSSAFDGLLSLIPAKYYYDDKTQEQWKQKKKSKAQSKLDKRSKLDPELQNEESASALEIKAQREKDGQPVVLPGSKAVPQASDSSDEVEEDEEEEEEIEEEEAEGDEDQGRSETENSKSTSVQDGKDLQIPQAANAGPASEDEEAIDVIFDDEGNEVGNEVNSQTTQVPKEDTKASKSDSNKTPKADRKENLAKLRAKLQEKIQSLKERRKAPGTSVSGAPSSREAILEQRKRKQEQKRKRSELDKAKQDESSDNESSDSEAEEETDVVVKKRKTGDEDLTKDLMFQNIEFDDGSRATSDLQRLRKSSNKKGPAKNDIKAHLQASELRRAKLEEKDELEQIKQKEKEKWQRAMLQAEGEKFRDGEKLLRKALKRKEAKKRKSAVEWRERKESVATAISDKQKRREENLQIRKDNKGKKRSHQEKMKRGIKGVRPQKRAGFEGRLKSQKKR
ncbi:LAME_0E01112g1_1 [Lachancea meyersii CBS 8951]|uniref:LAME_0E01112g1_1 n=1 Tax=Lachancea meyersii CBS 8951 TaxID=1266667 RepID=A0A1G4JEW1_9SACH|nr:LAME_0E01112g1_1 [Lachancea meyersii CBS 8951]